MKKLAWILVAAVALLQFGFMLAEMLAWESVTAKLTTFPKIVVDATKELGANQGLYNGFLAAGLIWALRWPLPTFDLPRARFFLICVAVAGAYGAYSINTKLLFAQTVPALVALAAVWRSR